MARNKGPKRPAGKVRTWMRTHQHRLALVGLFLGLALIGYFPASEYIDAYRRQQITEKLDARDDRAVMEKDETQWWMDQAKAYNAQLAGEVTDISYDDILPYDEQLDPQKTGGAFAYVTIPKIRLKMPIYHGTSDEVLSAGAGHVKGTSLPVGGDSTHSVVSAHSGMAQMRAFDDIRLLEKGDMFGFRALGRDFVYEVTDIQVVEPHEVDRLKVKQGEDISTLVTCTPLGINTKRLLVMGKRVATPADWNRSYTPPTVAQIASNDRVWPFLAACVFVMAVIVMTGFKARRESAVSPGKEKTRENEKF